MTAKRICAVGGFPVNILALSQQDISIHHAGATGRRPELELAGTDGVPSLDGANAVFLCRLEAKHLGGDHRILMGKIEEKFDPETAATPLLSFGLQY